MVKFNNGEWTCIAQKCTKYVTGDEWVKENCKPVGANYEMICEFTYQGEAFSVPLKGITDISNMESCVEYTCDSEVYIRGNR